MHDILKRWNVLQISLYKLKTIKGNDDMGYAKEKNIMHLVKMKGSTQIVNED